MAPTRKSHNKAIKQFAKKQKAQKKFEKAKKLVSRDTVHRYHGAGGLGGLHTDLILIILQYMEPVEKVSFALASRHVYATLCDPAHTGAPPKRLKDILSIAQGRCMSCYCSFNPEMCLTCLPRQIDKLIEYISCWMPSDWVLCGSRHSWHTPFWAPISKIRDSAQLAATSNTWHRSYSNLMRMDCEEGLENKIADHKRRIAALPTRRFILLRPNCGRENKKAAKTKTVETAKQRKRDEIAERDAEVAKLLKEIGEFKEALELIEKAHEDFERRTGCERVSYRGLEGQHFYRRYWSPQHHRYYVWLLRWLEAGAIFALDSA